MSKNLANTERQTFAIVKRIRKANKLVKVVAHGGFGELAKAKYLEKYPEAKVK